MMSQTDLPELIFLLSLPRSGSTLLQRMLATHPKIATAAEPWMLLPQIYPFFYDNLYAPYRNVDFQAAAKDFFDALPDGQYTYWKEVNDFIRRIYGTLGTGAKYFLDKTPRYSLIAPNLATLFPNSKFVFLFRNPLAILASINQVWGKKHWKIYTYKVDLFLGLNNLLETYKVLSEQGRCVAVCYESLLKNPEEEIAKVFDFLDLSLGDLDIFSFQQISLKGVMGDPKRESLRNLSLKPLTAWKSAPWNLLRKLWARRYLRWIGKERLALMGYSLSALLIELDELPLSFRFLVSDSLRFAGGVIYHCCEPVIFRDKLRKWKKWWSVSALR